MCSNAGVSRPRDILDPPEEQGMSRSRRPGLLPIRSLQQKFEISRRHRALGNLNQTAHHGAHHMPQERPSCHTEPGEVTLAIQPTRINNTPEVYVFSLRRCEGGEIVLPFKYIDYSSQQTKPRLTLSTFSRAGNFILTT